MGVGKLRLAQLSESKTFIEVWVTVGRVYGNCSSTQPAICVSPRTSSFIEYFVKKSSLTRSIPTTSAAAKKKHGKIYDFF